MATDNVSLNAGVDNAALNAGADNVGITVPGILVETGGSFVIRNAYEVETGGFYRLVENFLVELSGQYIIRNKMVVQARGESEILGFTFSGEDLLTGECRIFNVFNVEAHGSWDILGSFALALIGQYDIGIKRVIVETTGQYDILTGNEQAKFTNLEDFKVSVGPNPDVIAVPKFPKIITAKVWEEQSFDITLKFRKEDGTVPAIKTMTWDLKTLGGVIINGRDDVVVVAPTADQDFALAGDDLVLLNQNNEHEWRDLEVTATYDPENGQPDATLVETVRFAVFNVGSVV